MTISNVHVLDALDDALKWYEWLERSTITDYDFERLLESQKRAIVCHAELAKLQRSDPLPWDPASACEVPVYSMDISHGRREEAETGAPGHQVMASPEWAAEMREKRAQARRTAKTMLLNYFKKLHHASGLKWSSDHVIGIGEIVDAILTAAGA